MEKIMMLVVIIASLVAVQGLSLKSHDDETLLEELVRMLSHDTRHGPHHTRHGPHKPLNEIETLRAERELDNTLWEQRYNDLRNKRGDCGADEYKCKEEDRCVHSMNMCDEYGDCWNAAGDTQTNEDEKVETCKAMKCVAPDNWEDVDFELVRCQNDGKCLPDYLAEGADADCEL